MIAMNHPTVACPNCGHEIRLTESLAAPLINELRAQYEAKLAEKEADVSKREAGVRTSQAAIKRQGHRSMRRWACA
jgi:uncharacterized protein involved in exopolysaccharide biosynthesis